jgi:hypothetical protein
MTVLSSPDSHVSSFVFFRQLPGGHLRHHRWAGTISLFLFVLKRYNIVSLAFSGVIRESGHGHADFKSPKRQVNFVVVYYKSKARAKESIYKWVSV